MCRCCEGSGGRSSRIFRLQSVFIYVTAGKKERNMQNYDVELRPPFGCFEEMRLQKSSLLCSPTKLGAGFERFGCFPLEGQGQEAATSPGAAATRLSSVIPAPWH